MASLRARGFFAIIVVTACGILGDIRTSSTSERSEFQQEERDWELRYFDGISARIACNRLTTDVLVHNRKIFILLGKPYFNQNDLKKMFLAIANEYNEPEFLVVTALSDRDQLKSELNKRETTTLYVVPDKDLLDRSARETNDNNRYYRAYYLRMHDDERFGYTLDPVKGEYTTVNLRP